MINRIKQDMTDARKSLESFKAGLLSLVYSDAMMIAKNAKKDFPTDQEVISVVKKILKGCKESLGYLSAVGDSGTGRLLIITNEIEILNGYLPRQLTREEIIAVIGIPINFPSIRDVMEYLKKNFPNQYDGKMVAGLVKELKPEKLL